MRSLVLSSFVVFIGCGGSVDDPSAPPPQHELPAPTPDLLTCAGSEIVATSPRVAHDLAVSGYRAGWIESDDERSAGTFTVEHRAVTTDVAMLSASREMFAFAFAGGGLGVQRASTTLRPGPHAVAVAADVAEIAWVDASGRVLRADLDGEAETIAEHAEPVIATAAGATWFVTRDGKSYTVQRTIAHDPAKAIATLAGAPLKIVAVDDRAFVSTGTVVTELGDDLRRDVWQATIVDFAADAREVVVGEEHAIDRVGSTMRVLPLADCSVRGVALTPQLIVVLARSTNGDSHLLRIPR
jgi:hypothetical protein